MTTQTRLLSVPPAMSGFCDDRGNEIPFEVKTINRYNMSLVRQTSSTKFFFIHWQVSARAISNLTSPASASNNIILRGQWTEATKRADFSCPGDKLFKGGWEDTAVSC